MNSSALMNAAELQGIMHRHDLGLRRMAGVLYSTTRHVRNMLSGEREISPYMAEMARDYDGDNAPVRVPRGCWKSSELVEWMARHRLSNKSAAMILLLTPQEVRRYRDGRTIVPSEVVTAARRFTMMVW